MDQTTTAAIVYAAETGAIVRIQWGLGLILICLLAGILVVNTALRRRIRRTRSENVKLKLDIQSVHKDATTKTEAALKEQRRLRRLLENTEKALIEAKETIDTLIEMAKRRE